MEGATKHTDMRHLELRELQAQGVFTIEYCRTNKMMADLFTKNLPAPPFTTKNEAASPPPPHTRYESK